MRDLVLKGEVALVRVTRTTATGGIPGEIFKHNDLEGLHQETSLLMVKITPLVPYFVLSRFGAAPALY